MNERYSGPQGPQQEITDDEKRAFVAQVREIAPFSGQPVDRFGAYETRFLYGEEGYVSVYVPGLSGVEVPGSMIDDAVTIIQRLEDELDNGMTIVHMKQYKIEETDLTATYSEDTKVFNTETGALIGPKAVDDIPGFIEAQNLRHSIVDPTFTTERLREAYELLDSLDPNDTF